MAGIPPPGAPALAVPTPIMNFDTKNILRISQYDSSRYEPIGTNIESYVIPIATLKKLFFKSGSPDQHALTLTKTFNANIDKFKMLFINSTVGKYPGTSLIVEYDVKISGIQSGGSDPYTLITFYATCLKERAPVQGMSGGKRRSSTRRTGRKTRRR